MYRFVKFPGRTFFGLGFISCRIRIKISDPDPDPAKHGPNPKPWLDGDEIRRDSYNIKRFEPQERQSQLNSVKC